MALTLTPRGSGAPPGPLRLNAGSAVIGRADGADLPLAHPLVSSRHCVVAGEGATWRVEDVSTNGTMVNGRRVAGAQPLRHGDVIGIADIEVAVAIDGAAAAAPRAPAKVRLDDWGRGGTNAPAPTQRPAASRAPVPMVQAAGLAGGADRDAAAGAALKAAVAGLAELAQARAKARRDLKLADPVGQANPILAGDPAALAELTAMPPAAAADAVAAAAQALAAHQRASLGAMQAAFKAALDQFAPAAVKLRARDNESAWRLYEKAFAADDGFVEGFAKAFAEAYERLSRGI